MTKISGIRCRQATGLCHAHSEPDWYSVSAINRRPVIVVNGGSDNPGETESVGV